MKKLYFKSIFNWKEKILVGVLMGICFLPAFQLESRAQQSFTNFQEASIVIGQSSFETADTGNSYTKAAGSVAVSVNGKLAIGSKRSGRIWIWNSIPTTNGVLPDVTLTNIETEGLTFSPDGTLLIATDAFNGRVLVWDGIPTEDDQPHDYAINGFTYPTGVAVDPNSGKLVVCDFAEDNIRVFSQPPSDAGSHELLLTYGSRGTEETKFYGPWGCAISSTGRLVIADRNNHRVMIFSGIPTTTEQPVSVVLGQTDFTSNSPGTSATTFYNPAGVAISPSGQLAVGEWANSRVSIFNAVPWSNGATIDVILGQPVDYSNTELIFGSPSSQNMARVGHVAFEKDGRLFVSGENMNRVMVFGEASTPVPNEVGPEGGTVASEDNKVALNVPSGALTNSTIISGVVTTEHPDGSIGIVYDFQPDGLTFDNPAELVFNYAGIDLGGLDPSNLTVAFAENGAWVEVSSVVNTTDQTITAQITHFTPYGIIEKTTDPAPPTAVQTFPNGFGGFHTLILDENNQLWAGGRNDLGNCGVGDFRYSVNPFENISTNGDLAGERIISIATGAYHSLALDDEGNVYSWGYNYSGQLGLGDRQNRNLPTKIPSLNNIIKISAGIISSVAIHEDGTVYTWGFGRNSSIGFPISSPYQQLTPRIMSFPSEIEIIDVALGYDHGLALTINGEVFGWGSKQYLGVGITTGIYSLPVLLPSWGNDNIKIVAGRQNSYSLNTNGQVKATGNNAYGQMGVGTVGGIYTSISYVRSNKGTLTNISHIHGGHSHFVALNEQKLAYSWGYNAYGQVGIGTTSNIPFATVVPNPDNSDQLLDIVEIFGGYFTSYGKTLDGSIYGWGYNHEYQFGSEYPGRQPLPVPLNLPGSADEPPTILTQNITISLDENGLATITPEQVDNGSSDDSGELTLSLDITEFTCENIGENTVTLTGTDGNGNSTEATAVVTVVDDAPPVLSLISTTVYLDENGQGTLSVTDIYDPLNSSDNCGIDESTLAIDIASFDCAQAGTQVDVTLSVQDNNGNESSGTIAVSVVDEIPPAVVTQNITVPLDATGNASITAGQIDYGSSDNCSIAAMSLDVSSFNCDNLGDNIVTLTVEDASGNTENAKATVTVIDNTGPIAKAKNIVIALNSLGLATITPSDIDDNSSDNCSITDRSLSRYDFNFLDLFAPQVVKLTVEDQSGNTNEATATVAVIDNIPPVVQVKNITVSLDATGSASISPEDVDNGTEDFGGIALRNLSKSSFTCSDLGENTISFSAIDNTGISAAGNAVVTIIDNVAPSAIAQDLTVQLDANGNASITAAQVDNGSSDACGIASLSVSPSSFNCSNVGANTVTLTATDNNGNVSTANATVTVEDNVGPVAISKNITIQLDGAGNASITASQIDDGSSDACGITSLAVSPSSFNCSNVGANTVTLTATDNNGNVSTANATVTVQDNVPPVAVAQDLTIQLDADGSASITASQLDDGSSDACGIASLALSQTSFDCSNVGPNLVTLTVTDNNGNISTATATVTVEDKVAPVALAKDLTVQLDANGNASITAAQIDNGSSDACGIASLAVSPNSFDCSNVGANTVTLTATDNNGNVSTANATVTVEDNVAPVAISKNITIQLDGAGNASITASQIDNGSSDACGIASLAISPSSFNCSNVGANTVTLTATDNNGNVSTANATVTVEDNVAPVALAKDITIQLDAIGNASIAAADVDNGSSDACRIASLAISPSSFDCSNVGANTVTLTATDNNGNVSTATATVTVEDNVAPVALAKDITIQLDAIGNASIAAADVDNGSSDACGIASLSVAPSSFNCSNVGANTVTLTVTDNNGNVSTANATVTVQDNVAPEAAAQDLTIQLDADGNASITASQFDDGSSDACGIASLAVSPSSFDCSNVGANTVTLTVTDNNGNVSTASATVTVEDNVAPVAMAKDLTLQLDADGSASITPVQIDNGSSDACGIASFEVSPSEFGCEDIGENSVVLIVTDNNGNTASADATVTVTGIIPQVNITQSVLPEFCQGAVLLLTANSDEAVAYDWLTGASTQVAEVSANGLYDVTVTSATNCKATAEYTVSGFDAGALISSYTILAEEEVHLHGTNIVSSGGVGVIKEGKKVKLHELSQVVDFVQASEIDIKDESTVGTEVYAPAAVVIPEFIMNTRSEKDSPDITVIKNTVVNLTEEIYGKVEIEEGAKVVFEASNIYMEELKTKKNTYIEFEGCANLYIKKELKFDKGTIFNATGNSVVIFVDDEVEVKEGSRISARIHAHDNEIFVKGKDTAPSVMNGLFIGKKIHGNKYVTWNMDRNCDTCPLPAKEEECEDCETNTRIADAGISEKELIEFRGISIYPNPVQDVLTIQVPKDFTIDEHIQNIHLFSMTGVDVIEFTQRSSISSGMEIDVEALPAGIYILIIAGAETTFKYKVNKM